jgi:hypothetical protein
MESHRARRAIDAFDRHAVGLGGQRRLDLIAWFAV